MIYDMTKIDKKVISQLTKAEVKIVCGCIFCNGEEQKETVEHYKLFGLSTGTELYLNIDKDNNRCQIILK